MGVALYSIPYHGGNAKDLDRQPYLPTKNHTGERVSGRDVLVPEERDHHGRALNLRLWNPRFVYVHTHTYIYIYIHIHRYIYIYIYNIYIYRHISMQRCRSCAIRRMGRLVFDKVLR